MSNILTLSQFHHQYPEGHNIITLRKYNFMDTLNRNLLSTFQLLVLIKYDLCVVVIHEFIIWINKKFNILFLILNL